MLVHFYVFQFQLSLQLDSQNHGNHKVINSSSSRNRCAYFCVEPGEIDLLTAMSPRKKSVDCLVCVLSFTCGLDEWLWADASINTLMAQKTERFSFFKLQFQQRHRANWPAHPRRLHHLARDGEKRGFCWPEGMVASMPRHTRVSGLWVHMMFRAPPIPSRCTLCLHGTCPSQSNLWVVHAPAFFFTELRSSRFCWWCLLY